MEEDRVARGRARAGTGRWSEVRQYEGHEPTALVGPSQRGRGDPDQLVIARPTESVRQRNKA